MPKEDQVGGGDKSPQRLIEEKMAVAATYEQLLVCWASLIKGLDRKLSETWGTLEFNLKNLYDCFSKSPFECDSIAKNIFEKEDLLKKMFEMKIPAEFILQTTRVGAIKGILDRVERGPGKPTTLYSDGTMSRMLSEQIEGGRLDDQEKERQRLIGLIHQLEGNPSLDGFSWANEKLRDLATQKDLATRDKREAGKKRIESEKLAAIERIKSHMHETDFHLTQADTDLLREDFRDKLHLWKGILESTDSAELREELNSFLDKNPEAELTPEFFAMFHRVYELYLEKHPDITYRSSLPLEIIDPDSGWFSVVIINKQIKLRNFITSVYGNFGQWFQL